MNVTLGQPGMVAGDTAAGFNGSSSSVSTTSAIWDQTGPFSVEAWFKTSSTSQQVVYRTNGNYGTMIYINPTVSDVGKVGFQFYDSGAHKYLVESPFTVNDGQWHQVVGTYSGDGSKTERLYVDGRQVASATYGSPVFYSSTGAAVGRWGTRGISIFNGTIDEVALYGSVLSDAGSYSDPTGLVYLIRRYYDPTTGQFISVDPAVDQTEQPFAYANGDPVQLDDPLGLGCGSWLDPDPLGCAKAFASNWKTGASDALPAVHKVSGYVAAGASLCAVATSETIVGGVTCGAVALGAGGINAASGAVLYHEHRESAEQLGFEVAAVGASGAGRLFEVGARSAAVASSASRAIGGVRALRAADASGLERPGLWLSSQWLFGKAALWDALGSGLRVGSRSFAAFGFGLGLFPGESPCL